MSQGGIAQPGAALGTEEQKVLMEQYKLYVEMTDRVSSRRIEASKFYLSILTGILALLSLASIPAEVQPRLVLAVAVLGLLLCVVWFVNIISYRTLNSLKFRVIHEMERQLPFACYDREWQILKQDPRGPIYVRLTFIERFVPILMLLPYLVLLGYAISRL